MEKFGFLGFEQAIKKIGGALGRTRGFNDRHAPNVVARCFQVLPGASNVSYVASLQSEY